MVWVFKTSPREAGNAVATDARPADGGAEGPLLVHRLSLERDVGNARLDIDVRVTNKHAKKLQLVQPAMKLIAGKDHVVPEFFLPVEPPPEVGPKTTADVHLRYWLEKTDLAGGLTLQFEDQSVVVKSDKPFDLEKLKNAEPKTLTAGDW